MKFNKCIDMVGIEFEGFFDPEFHYALRCGHVAGDLVRDVGSDGSISKSASMSDVRSAEARTKPLKEAGLAKVLRLFATMQDEKKYQVNASCGLHYHISLLDGYYPLITNRDFYDSYCQMFSRKFRRIYHSRKSRYHCVAKMDKKDNENHFTFESGSRYRMINYCYKKHGTVEFRGFGGHLAKVKDLAKMIQLTIDLIGEATEKRQKNFKPITKKVFSSSVAKPQMLKFDWKRETAKKQILNIDLPPKQNIPAFNDGPFLNPDLYFTPGTASNGTYASSATSEETLQGTVYRHLGGEN